MPDILKIELDALLSAAGVETYTPRLNKRGFHVDLHDERRRVVGIGQGPTLLAACEHALADMRVRCA